MHLPQYYSEDIVKKINNIWTVHLYCPNGAAIQGAHKSGNIFIQEEKFEVLYIGQPYFIDEWGGSRYSADTQSKGWGYGEDPLSAEELLTKIVDHIEALLKIKGLQGYCYTQLADIEQEQNGLLTEKSGSESTF